MRCWLTFERPGAKHRVEAFPGQFQESGVADFEYQYNYDGAGPDSHPARPS
jgi:hypothetical protein